MFVVQFDLSNHTDAWGRTVEVRRITKITRLEQADQFDFDDPLLYVNSVGRAFHLEPFPDGGGVLVPEDEADGVWVFPKEDRYMFDGRPLDGRCLQEELERVCSSIHEIALIKRDDSGFTHRFQCSCGDFAYLFSFGNNQDAVREANLHAGQVG
jgi:hypothetical protein